MQRAISIIGLGLVLASIACGAEDASTPPTTEIASAGGVPTALVVAGDSVYWVTAGEGGHLYRAPKAGGPAIAIADARQGGRLVSDGHYVYLSTQGGLSKVSTTGGALIPVSLCAARSIAAGGGNLFWSDGAMIVGTQPSAGPQTPVIPKAEHADLMVADDTHLYYLERLEGLLMQARLDGSDAKPIDFLAGDSAATLTQDRANVYWGLNGYLSKVSKADGTKTVLSGGYRSVGEVWADGTSLYTIGSHAQEQSATQIRRMPATGGDFVTAIANIHPVTLAVDEAYVYWADVPDATGAGATIRRAAK